ncbi:MLP-like protein 423 [Andrographis paniculata]|uniref:MLP-like protein 423 n=1 Tax=Andrographis paniculata TaxID=175694 RepID=UPI0021E70FC9|nr:MLP-like protein 423 [Andrographis paniculata]
MSEMASTIEMEVELKSSANQIWEALKNLTTLFPKAMPHIYKSIEVLEGDGQSVGSIRLVKIHSGIPEISSKKVKLEKVDEANKSVEYTVIGGDLLHYFKIFKWKTMVSSKGDGSVVKWSCNYDKVNEDFPNSNIVKEFTIKKFKELDAYLLKAN